MPNYLNSIIHFKCPKCRKGDLFCNKNSYQFKGFFDMHKKCEVCNQDFIIETGFYYGAMYVSYALTIAITVAVFVAMVVLNVFSIGIFLITDLIALLITLPYIYKISRAIWISIIVKYDPKHSKNNDNPA